MEQAIHRTQFGSDAMRDRNAATLRSLRHAQRVQVAVAPGVSLAVVRNGKAMTLQPGDEVIGSDWVGQETVTNCLWKLVDRHAVIALSYAELVANKTPATARYVVAKALSVSCKRGILPEGAEVTADLFEGEQAALDDLVARGAIIDRQVSDDGARKANLASKVSRKGSAA